MGTLHSTKQSSNSSNFKRHNDIPHTSFMSDGDRTVFKYYKTSNFGHNNNNNNSI